MARPIASWMNNIVFTNRVSDRYLHLCIWGAAGSGKTNFVGTAEGLFLIAPEDGTLTISDQEIPMLPLTENGPVYSKVKTVLQEAKKSEDPFWDNIKTIGIDSITKLNALLIKELKKQTGHSPLQMADWGILYSRIEEIVSLLNSLPFDTIVTAGEAIKSDPEDSDEIEVTVNMQGGYRHDFFYDFDFILYAEERKKGKAEPTYFMHTQTFKGRKAKIRKPKTAPAPPKEIQNCTFGMIKDMVSKYQKEEN